MKKNNEFVNEDTYQTLKEFRIDPPSQNLAKEPLWKDKPKTKPKKDYSIFVATPVHSDVSLHYTQALLEFQKYANEQGVDTHFQLMKSSLVTQGRNLCVSSFLESDQTHLLFIDSDIWFHSPSILRMVEKDKDIISIPYPLKTMMWEKLFQKIQEGVNIQKPYDLKKYLNTYPMRVENPKSIIMDNGVIEVTHSPTGCMLIKREVFEKMIKAYPDKNIVQKTVINGKYVDRPHMWNFFDTLHDPKEKVYLGEDFAFCKLWKDLGGKCYALVDAPIVHVGDHTYEGRFSDELISKS